MTKDLKASFARRSNEAWRDAHAPEGVLSDRTRAKCLFDAGYFCLLAYAPSEARERIVHHPDADFVREECARHSVLAETGLDFVAHELSAFDEDRPNNDRLLAWASELRARLL